MMCFALVVFDPVQHGRRVQKQECDRVAVTQAVRPGVRETEPRLAFAVGMGPVGGACGSLSGQ